VRAALPTSTDECASVTTAFLQARATAFRGRTKTRHTPECLGNSGGRRAARAAAPLRAPSRRAPRGNAPADPAGAPAARAEAPRRAGAAKRPAHPPGHAGSDLQARVPSLPLPAPPWRAA
jgi:hypothetical protein